MSNDIRKIFWTGGWDSTFRIIQLSRTQKITIQPVYVSGDNRKSEKIEIESMNKILETLRKREETKAKILPIDIVEKENIPNNDEITNAYKTIRNKVKLGTQYEYLARYAYANPGIEVGAECPDGEFSGIVEAIKLFGGVIQSKDTWIVDKDKATNECKLVFGNFSLPIVKTTEREMLTLVKQWGYEEVMKNIWFCHNPMKNQPCGLCRPCEQKMEEHMEFLLPPHAQSRYKNKKYAEKLFGKYGIKVVNKYYRVLNEINDKE